MNRALVRAAALRDIHRHADYIGERRLSAGRRFYKAAEGAIKKLAERRMLGGSCEFENPELTDLRVWSIKGFEHYLIFYIPLEDGVDVIRVLHASRDVENILRDELNPGIG
jgi:toxin ParE1/3/4